jgi:hypothetical protein
MPALVLLETVVARARRRGLGVIIGVLIQGDLKARVLVAEDVAASATMVATKKVIESSLARGIVAHG